MLLYVVIDAAAALRWLPMSCCLTQLMSVPAVSLHTSIDLARMRLPEEQTLDLPKLTLRLECSDAEASHQWEEGAALHVPSLLSYISTSVPKLVQAMAMLDFAKENHAVPEVICPLKRYALKWHMTVAAGLALGFAFGRAPASVIPRLLQA